MLVTVWSEMNLHPFSYGNRAMELFISDSYNVSQFHMVCVVLHTVTSQKILNFTFIALSFGAESFVFQFAIQKFKD